MGDDRPAELPGKGRQLFAVLGPAGAIGVAGLFGAAEQQGLAAAGGLEAGAAGIGEVLFRRIDDTQQDAIGFLGGEARQAGRLGLRRIEEVARQHDAAEAGNMGRLDRLCGAGAQDEPP